NARVMRTGEGTLTVRPLTAARVDDVKTVTRGTWGSQCWDLHPRLTGAQQRELGITGSPATDVEARRRAILAKLARRRRNTAGLVAISGSSRSVSCRSARAATSRASRPHARRRRSTACRHG